jgi:sucrose-6-phosphate hydrolase SacC (GH32 family)
MHHTPALQIATLFLCFTVPVSAADLLLADFEGKDYGEWKATGEAFGSGPAHGTLPGQKTVSGYLGQGLVNTFWKGDDSEGTLTSPELKIERRRMNFLAGGGRHPGEACINLVVDGKIARTATGADSEHLRWISWNVEDLAGKTARIEIVDRKKGSWGHINADHIVQSDEQPKVTDDRDGLLARAADGVKAAAERVKDDPARPVYHVLPPANWNNDPNGPLYHKGYYHLFYQHNPYGDEWGNMHWGHVRSKDLAHWEHLPIALWPSKALGEEHVFSGSAAVTRKGQTMLFYTSVGGRLPEQWAAIPEDDDLIRWKKHPENPLLTETLHGAVKVHEWRDPFFFREGNGDYLVCGGNLNASTGGQAVVNAYRAENEDLARWKYLGVLFQHPDASVKNIECPNFFKLGSKWVLIVSQGTPVEYFTGDLDLDSMKFRPQHRGVMDYGQYYAPICMEDPSGRRILWGWMNGTRSGQGWRHCLTLPRILSVREDGDLVQEPAPELAKLRGEEKRFTLAFGEKGSAIPIAGIHGSALEISARFDLGNARAVGLRVRESADRSRAIEIRHDGGCLEVAGVKAPLSLGPARRLDLRVFLDRSILEVYANGAVCVTRAVYPDGSDDGLAAFAEGAPEKAEVSVWPMKTAW